MYDHQRTVKVFLDAIAHLPDSCEYIIDTFEVGSRGYAGSVAVENNQVKMNVYFAHNHPYADNHLGVIRRLLNGVDVNMPLRMGNGTFESICGGEKFVFIFFKPEYRIFYFSPKWIPTFDELEKSNEYDRFLNRLSDFEGLEKVPESARSPKTKALEKRLEDEKKKRANEKRAFRRKELKKAVLDRTAPKGLKA